jgi:hypothetical protein
MTGHRLEVADVFHAHENEFLQRWGHVVSDQQRKVLRDIGLCRTAALGTHLERCDRCDYETVAYDSCRNRHCPKCQSSARDRWLTISNGRLLSLDNGQVRFRWRDSRHNNRSSIMTLDATEFIRRFLLHVLPAGFVKIRHFGLLANRRLLRAEHCRYGTRDLSLIEGLAALTTVDSY